MVVAEGPGWKVMAVWGLRMLAMLPLPITAIYVVKSQLAYGVVDVSSAVCYDEDGRGLASNHDNKSYSVLMLKCYITKHFLK